MTSQLAIDIVNSSSFNPGLSIIGACAIGFGFMFVIAVQGKLWAYALATGPMFLVSLLGTLMVAGWI